MNCYTNPWILPPQCVVLLKYLVGQGMAGPRLLNLGDLAEFPPCPKTLSFLIHFLSTVQMRLPVTHRAPPASASQALGLKVCATVLVLCCGHFDTKSHAVSHSP